MEELGGAVNYYTWNPSYHQDVSRTEGIQGVRVRTRTGFDLLNDRFTIDNGTATNIAAGMIADTTTINKTGDDLDRINEYLTDANGLIVADANTRYSSDGAAFNTGWIDWLQMGARNAASTTAGGNSTGSGFGGVEVPNNHIIAPIQFIGKDAYNQYSTSYEARSYSHDIDVIDEQNGVIGTGTGQQAADTLIPIQDAPVVGANLSTSRIKPANTNADNSPNFDSFTADSTVSLNDIGNALRALWAQYEVNANQGAQLQTGNFDETTYPTRIHIRTVAETGNNEWQETWGGARVASAGSGGQIRIAVLGNGIAGKDDDLYASLPGARTYNFAGLPLSDVPLQAQERLARIGNVHNVTLESGLDSAGPSGANDFYDIQFETDSNTITGLTTLSPGANRAATQAVINLPTVVGDADSDVTLTRGRITQTFSSGATVGDEGIRAGSNWTNFTTSSDVTATKIDGDLTISGGSHSLTVANVPTTAASDSFTWTFSGSPTLDITLPTGSPQGLVTIETGNQAGDESQYDIVKAWLDGITGLSYSNVRTDETAPTSGYWLVAPPLAPAEPRTYRPGGYIQNDNTVTTGATAYAGSINALGGFFGYSNGTDVTTVQITDATTLDDITINTNNEDPLTYTTWYKPANVVDTTGGAGYLVTQTTWLPLSQDNGTTVASPIANVLLSTAYAAGTQADHFVPANSLESGVAEYTISGFESTAAGPDETQAMALEIANTRLFFDAVTTASLTQAQQLVEFGLNQTTNFNGGTIADTVVPNLIRLTATNQNQVAAASGILSEALGSATAVISASVLQPLATTAQVAALASGASRNDVVNIANQITTSIQGTNVPGKGLLGTPTTIT